MNTPRPQETYYFRAVSVNVPVLNGHCVPLMPCVAKDGDTITVWADRGEKDYSIRDLRIYATDAPEIHSTNDLERQAGIAVRDWVQRWLNHAFEMKCRVVIECREKPEKFGRWLGDILVDAVSLSGALITAGLVKEYHGEKKKPWTDAELMHIIEECHRT